MKIWFKEQQFISINRMATNTISEFISSCGGLLGLFMGISLLSMIEFIYFFTLRLGCKIKRKEIVWSSSNLHLTKWRLDSILMNYNYAQVTFNRQNMIKLYILYPRSVHLLFLLFSYTFSVYPFLAFFAYISLLRPDTCLLPQTDPGLIQKCLYSFKGDAHLMFQSAMNN